jgi:outer membrane autotransporter protein
MTRSPRHIQAKSRNAVVRRATGPVLTAASAAAALTLGATPGFAACTVTGPTLAPTAISCDATSVNGTVGYTTPTGTPGGGPSGPPAGTQYNNVTINLAGGATAGSGAAINVVEAPGISVANGNTITLGSNSSIVVNSTQTGTVGPYNTGSNGVDLLNNNTLTINLGASVTVTGTSPTAEAVDVLGDGNVITNFGTITGAASEAVLFENYNNATNTSNTLTNYGTIAAASSAGTAIFGGNFHGLVFTNETGATVIGAVNLLNGGSVADLYTGSTITGLLSAGGTGNTIILDGTGTGTISGAFDGFQTLIKQNTGTWTVTGTLEDSNNPANAFTVDVRLGTLIVGNDNSTSTASWTVESGGTLQSQAQYLPVAITDNGTVVFAQTAGNATYAGAINGSGALVKNGLGTTVTLTGVNGFTGGLFLNQGSVAAGADSALGGSTGALVFNGGTLQFTSGFSLAGTRAITLNAASAGLAGGGVIDTQGFTTTIAPGITGAGGLTKLGSGTLILSGANQYTGGTTISAGTLQLGNGGTSGSLLGNVADAGTLAFDRADTTTFPGIVSGTGAVTQIGTGTTVLTGANSYTGGTSITAGTLQLGNGGTAGSIVGNVADAGTLAFNRADIVTFPGTITGIGGLSQIGSGTTILTAANSYTGATNIAAGTLQVDGSITSPTTVQSGATLRGTGTIFGNVQNNGVIAPGDPSVIGTLAITGSYADPGGNVTVRTLLNAGGPGNQITDRLLIAGNAVGTTSVTVQPIGAASAVLTGNTATSGISIIQVGGAASPASFALQGGYVADGPYQYRLFSFAQGASAASEVDPRLRALGITSVDDYRLQTVVVAAGQVGPNGEVTGQPIVVPQVATYRALPTAGLLYGQALADDLHRRLGETDYPGIPGTAPAGVPSSQMKAETFVRLKGWTGNFAGDNGRPSFDQDLWFVQAGLGIVKPNLLAGGDRLHVDAVVSSGGSDVTLTSNRSKLHFDVTSIGGTTTYQAARGWYVDAVLLGNFYSDTHFSTQQGGQLGGTMGTGMTASVEAGYPIPVGLGVVVEPRTSLTYQSLTFNDFTDSTGLTYHQTATQSAVGRIGARALRTYDLATPIAARLAPFVSVDFTNDFMGNGKEQVGGVNFSTSPLGTAMRAGGGVNAQIGKIAAYVDVGRTIGLGNGSASGWDGIAGVRLNF